MLRRFPAGALKNAPYAPADPLGAHRARERALILGVSPIPAGHMLQSNFASLFSQRHRITLYLGEWGIT